MVNHKENLNHALVLGGGGSLAIGWQLGYISALDQAGIDVRHSDLVIGTSGGHKRQRVLPQIKVGKIFSKNKLPLNPTKNRQARTCLGCSPVIMK